MELLAPDVRRCLYIFIVGLLTHEQGKHTGLPCSCTPKNRHGSFKPPSR
jgi:hypothetical protein